MSASTSDSLTHRFGTRCEPLPTFLPTDFGVQGPAGAAKPVLRIVKVTVSGL